MRRRLRTPAFSGVVAALLFAAPLAGQTDTDRATLRAELQATIEALREQEAGILGTADPMGRQRGEPDAERIVDLRARLVTLLDSAVLRSEWGDQELAALRREHPGSMLLMRYDAELALREGAYPRALLLLDDLTHRAPADAALQRARGRALLGTGRTDDAGLALARALDLDPENEESFRLLLHLHRERGTLDRLLSQIDRLRMLHPEVKALDRRSAELRLRLRADDTAPRGDSTTEDAQ